jgi:hypothetical protein
MEAVVYAGLGIIVAGASLLHRHYPPPLTAGSAVPWLAVVGGTLAIVGGALKGAVLLRAGRAVP